MKVLLFGDGPQHKEKAKALREQNGWTVQLRSIRRWTREVEPVDAVYFLAPADTIRAAYKARGIECFLVEESNADAATPEQGPADANAAPAGDGASSKAENGVAGEAPKAVEGEEGVSEKAPDARPERQTGRKGK